MEERRTFPWPGHPSLEADAGNSKVGVSKYKNVTSGEQGFQASVLLPAGGVQITNPTPNTGDLTIYAKGVQVVISLFGFEKNVTRDSPTQFKPYKDFSVGAAFGPGAELTFNFDKFQKSSAANAACRAVGGS